MVSSKLSILGKSGKESVASRDWWPAGARFSNKHKGTPNLGIGKETLFLTEAYIHPIKQEDEPEERRLQ